MDIKWINTNEGRAREQGIGARYACEYFFKEALKPETQGIEVQLHRCGCVCLRCYVFFLFSFLCVCVAMF